MAASAWIVPGPIVGPTGELASPAPSAATLSPIGSRARLAWALLPAPFLGFALGVALAIAQAPPSRLPDVRVGAPPPAATWPARELQPRFWRPSGSTAVRPEIKLHQRSYRPALRAMRFAARATTSP